MSKIEPNIVGNAHDEFFPHGNVPTYLIIELRNRITININSAMKGILIGFQDGGTIVSP